ncbi:MAG: GNAT family N-acetyltransferase [Halodesulfurarchaeum sp.]
MTFAVSPATSADLESVLECWVSLVESQRAHGSHIEGETNRRVARDLLGQYIAGDMLSVARPAGGSPGGPILGFVMFYRDQGLFEESEVRGTIENVYVVPEARGEGVGTALLDHAEGALADRGVTVVSLSAMADNDRARDWYRERGYEPHRITFERAVED